MTGLVGSGEFEIVALVRDELGAIGCFEINVTFDGALNVTDEEFEGMLLSSDFANNHVIA